MARGGGDDITLKVLGKQELTLALLHVRHSSQHEA